MEDHIQRKHKELQELEAYLQRLNNQLESLQEKSNEIANVKDALEEVKKIESGRETLVTLSNGIFLKGEIKETDKVLVNVGADVVVEKTIEEAKELVEEQEKEIESYKSELIKAISETDNRCYRLEREFLELTDKALKNKE